MFSIFQKKEYLIDYLSGITDIHNHILPGIDDGAATVEDSVNLLKRFNNIGIVKFIATPHIMNDFYPNTPGTINAAQELLKKKIVEEKLENIQISTAAEYMMDQAFIELLESGNLLTLKGNYILVEMSYFQAPINLNEILFKLQTLGYKPVLAHPERYAFFHSKDLSRYQDLKNRGCLFQLNSLSLTLHYGKGIQKTANLLIENGMVDFMGSDTHRIEHIDKLETIQLKKNQMRTIEEIIINTKSIF